MTMKTPALLVAASTTAALMSACEAESSAVSPVTASPEVYDMAAAIQTELAGEVVGYSFALYDAASDTYVSDAAGVARLEGDGGPVAMSPDTNMIIASVSKWVTALATLSVLQDQGLSTDTPIGPYFPSEWDVDPYIQALTFGQLLSQTSGIKDFGNGLKDYALMQEFFTQPVNPDAETGCDGPWADTPEFGVTLGDQSFCYSNYNAGILQILLPRLAGLDEDSNVETRGLTLAQQFEDLVQTHVFEPVGVDDASCAPESDSYALSYIYPGEAPGKDWGSQYGRCATGGWYTSAIALARINASIAERDGRIVREDEEVQSLSLIREGGYGLDRNTPAMTEKSGVLGDDPGVLAASAMIRYGADQQPHLVAVLFVNSTNSQIRIAHARPILERAYNEAYGAGE